MASLPRSIQGDEGEPDFLFHQDFREIDLTAAPVLQMCVTATYVSVGTTLMAPIEGDAVRFMPWNLTTGGVLSEEFASLLDLQASMSALSDEFRAWELASDEDMRAFEDGLE